MADRTHTSSNAEDVLNNIRDNIRDVIDIEYGMLAKIALSYSLLKCGTKVPNSKDFSGKEIRRKSLFGNDELLFKSIIHLIYKKGFDDDEFISNDSIIKNHIDNGCMLIKQVFEQEAKDGIRFLKHLNEEVQNLNLDTSKELIEDLDITVGRKLPEGTPLVIQINNTKKHANPHLAIIGKTGVGKTQLLLKILTDIRKQSLYQTNFIIIDYKGDITNNEKFVKETKATIYNLPSESLPINPFVLDDYNEKSIKISAVEKAESFASIDNRFGPVQKQRLMDIIISAYERREKENNKYPDFKEIYSIAKDIYDRDDISADLLIASLRNFADFSLFWEHKKKGRMIEKLTECSIIVNLSKMPVLKELVCYLIIERLYKELSVLPDSLVKNDRREIRTVLVIDEAHNYLPQKNIFLQKIVREGRSKGLAIFFASQSPSDYVQKVFDFKELLEFIFVFQTDGASRSTIQQLLGCGGKVGQSLQTELAKLKPFHVISKALVNNDRYTTFEALPFYKAY